MLQLPDSAFVNGASTNAQGQFELQENVSGKSYLIKTEAFGYEKNDLIITSPVSEALHITLTPISTELAEVVVRGKTPVTTREGGKFIFIPNDLADDVSNANNLMKYVPFVSWTDEGAFIQGKGLSKVYLNGKDTHWGTNEIQAMLRTLNPHYIKRVEIVTDPGALVSASFGGGIINIIYDDPMQGWRGNLHTILFNSPTSTSVLPNLWLNYQKDKFKASVNFSAGYSHSDSKKEAVYQFNTLDLKRINYSQNKSNGRGLGAKVNVNYDLTPMSTLGAAVNLGFNGSNSTNIVRTTTESNGVTSYSQLIRNIHGPKSALSPYGLIYYTLITDRKGSNLDIFAGYKFGTSHDEITDDFDTPEGKYVENRSEKNKNSNLNAHAKYQHVFSPLNRLFTGLEIYHVANTNDENMPDDYYRYKYNHFLAEGFVQYNRVWNNFISTDIGLRLENTHAVSNLVYENERNTQNYINLFPSATISLNINKFLQNVSLAYNRSIYRPVASMLNPYRTWLSSNSYSQGNPNLKPEFSDIINTYFKFKQNITLGVSYTYIDQLTQRYSYGTDDGYTVSSFTNWGYLNILRFSFNFDRKLYNFWATNLYAAAGYRKQKTKLENTIVANKSWYGTFQWENKFLISRRHFLSANLINQVSTPIDQLTFKEDWRYSIVGLISKAFRCGVDMSLSFTVPVIGYKKILRLDTPEYSAWSRDVRFPYFLDFRVSYTFGKQQVRGAKDRGGELQAPTSK